MRGWGRPDRVEPGPGQESVWDYPRPPRVEVVPEVVRVEHGGRVVAETGRALRVLETASPPTYYLPPSDVDTSILVPASLRTFCEWKGRAVYWDLEMEEARVESVAWSYPDPTPSFAELRDHLAFFAGRVDACWVGEERVRPQEGGFYGGWITSRIVGPIKGAPGTEHW